MLAERDKKKAKHSRPIVQSNGIADQNDNVVHDPVYPLSQNGYTTPPNRSTFHAASKNGNESPVSLDQTATPRENIGSASCSTPNGSRVGRSFGNVRTEASYEGDGGAPTSSHEPFRQGLFYGQDITLPSPQGENSAYSPGVASTIGPSISVRGNPRHLPGGSYDAHTSFGASMISEFSEFSDLGSDDDFLDSPGVTPSR